MTEENNNATNKNNVPTTFSQEWVESFAERYLDQYAKFASKIAGQYGTNNLNPIYANSAMKKVNGYSYRPSSDDIIKMLNSPQNNEQQLRNCSNFLFYASQYYQRSISYLANILDLNYELIAINPPPANSNKKTIDLYKKQKQLANDFLRKFRLKEQFSNITLDCLIYGGGYYYLRESENGLYLQNMPYDYCYINGKTDVLNYSYSMNMSFFYQFPNSVSQFAPEFADFYKEFLDKNEILNKQANPYRMMPLEKSVVFKINDQVPQMIPPQAGTFKDSLEIEMYSDLIKLKAELETFEILFMKSPLDADGKPTISAGENLNYMALTQSFLPKGVAAIASPFEMTEAKFNQSQTMSQIIPLGSSNFWNSTGISSVLFSASKSAVGIQLGVQSDFEYMSALYLQFERFINHKLSLIDGKFDFQIKFLRRSNYSISDDRSEALQFAQSGTGISRALSSLGYEPYQHEAVLIDNKISGLNDLLMPIQTSFTMSSKDANNKGGAPKKSNNELGDAGANQRDGGYNEGKFSSQRVCLNCGKTINSNKNLNFVFCNEDCQMEFAQSVIEENN